MNPRLHRIVPAVILAAALIVTVVLRIDLASTRHQFFYDEAVSYLAATGHMGAMHQALDGGMTGRWVPASSWQALMHPGPFWTFGRIASDLAHYDTHPPLYFWLLHVWVAVAGVHLRGGVVLNTGIALLTAVALFVLARRILRNDVEAALVVAVWSVSPQVVQVSQFARQYDLFALFAVLSVLAVLRACDLDRRFGVLDGAFLALTVAGGMLTHYQFAVVALTCAVYLLVRLLRTDRRRLLLSLASYAAGAVVFVALAPRFYLSLGLQHDLQSHQFQYAQFVERLHDSWTSLYSFLGLKADDMRHAPGGYAGLTGPLSSFIDRGGLAVAVGVVLIVAVAALVVLRRTRFGSALGAYWRRIDKRGMGTTLFFLVGIAAGIFGMYLTFRTPSYATRPRYLAPLYPFLAMAVVLVARLLVGRIRYVAIGALCLLVMLPASLGRINTFENTAPARLALLSRADHILVDGATRGTVFRILWWVPPKKSVYVGLDQQLVKDPAPWLDTLRPHDLFMGARVYLNNDETIGQVERLLGTRFRVLRRRGGMRGTALIDVLEDKSQAAGP